MKCCVMFREFANKYCILASVLILIAAVAQLLFVLRYSVNVIFWDQFDYIYLLKGFHWQHCFPQHNEHRIFFPKLVFVLLARLTKWDVRVETFFNWAFLQCSAILLYGILKRNVKRENVWILAISLCFFLSPQYYNNLLWGIQNCVQICLLSVIVAVFVFATVKNPWLRIHLAAMFSIVATFSTANGLVAWVALFPLVVMRNENGNFISMKAALWRERWRIAYWVFIAIIVSKLYFWDYQLQMGHHPPLAYPWIYPKSFVMYFLTYIGAGFLGDRGAMFHNCTYGYSIIGIVLCLIFALGCSFGLFNIKKNVSKLCLVIFVLLTAMVTSFGRANFGLEQALSPRYREYSVLFPILIIGMLIGGGDIKRFLGKIIFTFLFLGILLGTFFGWRDGIRGGKSWYDEQQKNRKILYSFETATDDELRHLHSGPQRIRKRAAILRDLKYNVFK